MTKYVLTALFFLAVTQAFAHQPQKPNVIFIPADSGLSLVAIEGTPHTLPPAAKSIKCPGSVMLRTIVRHAAITSNYLAVDA